MLESGRDCEEVLTQIMAVRSSLDQVGLLLMEHHIERCLVGDLPLDANVAAEISGVLKSWARFGLVPGARADLTLLDAPNHLYLAYRPGVPQVAAVWKDGALVSGRP